MKVHKIKGIIPYTEKQINVDVNGNNVILTGKNGCGKTQLLDSILQVLLKAPNYQKQLADLQQAISQTNRNIEIHNKNIITSQENLNRILQQLKNKKDNEYNKELYSSIDISNKNTKISQENINKILQYVNNEHDEEFKTALHSEIKDIEENIKSQQSALESRQSQLQAHRDAIVNLNQHNIANKSGGFHKNTVIEYGRLDEPDPSLILFFKASRLSNFHSVDQITSTQTEIKNIEAEVKKNRKDSNAGALIERFLASWEVQSALNERNKDFSVSRDLDSWKVRFTDALRILLDDDSTEIMFDPETLNYAIRQDGKVDFSFRDLSSGYSAILSVFTELLMQTEVSKYSPNTIPGFVIIDEIDAHLHASLQRKVLPFFTESFPRVQFIVSTHSPFVITSADNVMVFDLSTRMSLDALESELRYLSTGLVLESFFDVPINSVWLMEKMKKLSAAETFEDLNRRINELSDAESFLEPELLSLFYTAKIKLERLRKGKANV